MTHIYVTIHNTAKFSSLTFIISPTTNNTASSALQLLGKMWPSRVSTMMPSYIGGILLEALEEWSELPVAS